MKLFYYLILISLLTLSWDNNAQIISQYVETDSGTSPKGIEIWNNTGASIDLSTTNLVIEKGTNGGTPSTDVTVDTGTLAADQVMVIGTADIQNVATNNGAMYVNKSFTFNGNDALVVKLDGTITDVFGTPNSDPGSNWSGNGVSTENSNIGLLDGISTGNTSGFTDPSTRFTTITDSPTASNGLIGFGIKPNAITLTLDNAGASAYFVTDQSSTITTLNTNNSDWDLEVGKRYLIDVVNPAPHPLMVRDVNDNLLLGMTNSDGSFSTDADVNFITDQTTGQFDFTLTSDLAQEINNYACQVHTSSMNGLINVETAQFDLQITELFPGQDGDDLTEDWFEITNNGSSAWVAGTDEDLYYDDESQDAGDAVLIQNITDIQPGESVVVVLTNDPADVTAFENVWSEVLDLSNMEVGYADGSGLGGGGDGATLWLGDPTLSAPIATGNYPDTAGNDGQSYDVELSEFSTVGNANGAVATLQNGGDNNDVPNIGSPGNAPALPADLQITELFPGQDGDDLTEDWFEITNNGSSAWVAGTDEDLYYDDESQDAGDAVLIQNITDIQPGESVVVVLTNDPADVTAFENVWSEVLDLSNMEVGYADGSGLGGGGDGATLWLGDPTLSAPIATGNYPDTAGNDGQSYDVELSEFSTVGNANGAVATLQNGGDNNDVPNIGSPGNAPAANTAQISFANDVVSVDENDGNISISLDISQAPDNDATLDVSLMMGGTAVEGTDFTFADISLTFPAGDASSQSIDIPIIDNATDDSSKFFALTLSNASNAQIGEDLVAVYILDDDQQVPPGDEVVLDITYLNSFTVDPNGTAEITDYDPTTEQLYVVNNNSIEIIDLSDPNNPSTVNAIDVSPFGDGAQSVAIKNNILAIAVANDVNTDNGFVLLYDPINPVNPVSLTVGALPDMLTFTNDGNTILVANEGEPNDDYTIDPEGSVSIIDVSAGLGAISQADVTTLDFNAFDAQEASLKANGVRIFGPNASVSQDLEPEYIAVAEDDTEAYVALQENNAYATIDLVNQTITEIKSFGLKDHSLPENSLDTSDETDFIFDATWPIKGMYMPDGITSYNVNGTDYIVTANEGDAREYDTFEEERDITDSDYNLDPSVFTNIELLELESNLGGINVTNANGDIDDDGLFEEIHVFGGRSFSIYEASSGNQIYDSGNDFAKITAADPEYGAIFNASNSNNNFKNRSDNKGVEPENVIVEKINGVEYAFIILERIGGVMVYDVSNPNAPVFLEYENNRGFVEGADESGDLGPEGIVYIKPEDNATDKGLLILSNEVSATLSLYQINEDTLSISSFAGDEEDSFKIYPNPAVDILNIDQLGDYSIYNLNGQMIKTVDSSNKVNVSDMSRGIYLIIDAHGNAKRFIKK